jgi:hypothetical protein
VLQEDEGSTPTQASIEEAVDGRGEDARPGCEDIPDDGARYARTSERAVRRGGRE